MRLPTAYHFNHPPPELVCYQFPAILKLQCHLPNLTGTQPPCSSIWTHPIRMTSFFNFSLLCLLSPCLHWRSHGCWGIKLKCRVPTQKIKFPFIYLSTLLYPVKIFLLLGCIDKAFSKPIVHGRIVRGCMTKAS